MKKNKHFFLLVLIVFTTILSCKNKDGSGVFPKNNVDFTKRVFKLYTNPKDPLENYFVTIDIKIEK